MPYDLKGRNVLVTGGSRGLGALICEKFAAEGSNVAINYNESKDRAEQVAAKISQEHGVRATVIQGDVGILADCERIVQETIDGLNGLDVIISNAGYTKFTSLPDLTALPEADWDKCWAVNCKAHLHLLRAALPTFASNTKTKNTTTSPPSASASGDNGDGGVFITTSSTAGVSVSGSSMAYSVSKAAGLHLVKCLAATQGPTVRVNAVLPGLMLTEWGENFGEERVEEVKGVSYLKRETDIEDTANAFIAVAKNGSMTGQFVQVDSGLSMLGRMP